MNDWQEMITAIRNLYSGTYHITTEGSCCFMDSKFSSINVQIEKGSTDKHVTITSDSWIDATGVGLLLIWLQENGYSYNYSRRWPMTK
jgi:hypothetical protein